MFKCILSIFAGVGAFVFMLGIAQVSDIKEDVYTIPLYIFASCIFVINWALLKYSRTHDQTENWR